MRAPVCVNKHPNILPLRGTPVEMRRLAVCLLQLLLSCSIWGRSPLAAGVSPGEMCFNACRIALQPMFNDVEFDTSPLAQSCHSRLRLTSLYLCLRVYCQGSHQSEGLDNLNRTCLDHAESPLPPFNIIANYTDHAISGLRHLQREEAVYTATLGEVVVPSDRLFDLSFKTHVLPSPLCLSHNIPIADTSIPGCHPLRQ